MVDIPDYEPPKKSNFSIYINGDNDYLIKNILLPKIGGNEITSEKKITIEYYMPIVRTSGPSFLVKDIDSMKNLESIGLYLTNDLKNIIYQKYYFYDCKAINMENSDFDFTDSSNSPTIKIEYSFEEFKIEYRI